MMYCSGTGLWGGLTTTFNGIFTLLRFQQRNTKCQSVSMTVFAITTVIGAIVSVVLPVIGTSTAFTLCCHAQCNIVASQIANTSIASLSFVQMVLAVMMAVFHSKYAFSCCNGGGDDLSEYTPGLPYLDALENDSNLRYRLW